MKLFLTAFVMMATVSLVGCSKDDEKEDNYTNSSSYAVRYQGRALEPGQKIVHTVTDAEREVFEVIEAFHFENKTESALQTRYKVEFVEGAESMKEVPVCYGECRTVTCPFSSEVFSLAPGVDNQEFSIHCSPDFHDAGAKGTYKITVGKTGSMDDPQVFFVEFIL